MEVFLLILRLVLAAVFAVAGIAKVFDPAGSEKAAADFGVPALLAKPVGRFLPAIELIVAAALLFTQYSWFAAIGAAALLLAFTAGMIVQIAKGNAPDCHCFGQLHSEPVGKSSVIRNLALLAVAGFLIVSGKAVQGVSFLNTAQDIMLFGLGIVVIGLLAIAVAFLKKISDQQTEIMKRVELMELVAREGGPVQREDVGHPHEGLPIGAVFPDFELPDLKGNVIALDDLKAAQIPLLFIFISPTCNPCNALIPEFEKWEKELWGRVKLVFISSGNAEENAAKFGEGHNFVVLLQDERELADQVMAKWTPTAVLMDARGRIASHVAAGDAGIRALVEKVKGLKGDESFTYITNGNGDAPTTKIGESVPRFSMADIEGNQITSDHFKGKQTLVAFWSLTCPFCQQMLEDLRDWDKVKGKDDPALVLFSDGDEAAHQELGLSSPVIIDEGHKTAAEFGMYGTPSAVLVNEDGRIISETAIGAPNIWSLIGRKH
jgi:peroxiredoxin/uncharacterized membrane protein YphA (DoxX/SURF4 family)